MEIQILWNIKDGTYSLCRESKSFVQQKLTKKFFSLYYFYDFKNFI